MSQPLTFKRPEPPVGTIPDTDPYAAAAIRSIGEVRSDRRDARVLALTLTHRLSAAAADALTAALARAELDAATEALRWVRQHQRELHYIEPSLFTLHGLVELGYFAQLQAQALEERGHVGS